MTSALAQRRRTLPGHEGVLLSRPALYHPCASTSVEHTIWMCVCCLLAIDIQSVQRFNIFSCVTEE
jgi:hypothetical protein